MKIIVNDFHNNEGVRVSMEAENSAEEFQVEALCETLSVARAECGRWANLGGGKGITLIVKKGS